MRCYTETLQLKKQIFSKKAHICLHLKKVHTTLCLRKNFKMTIFKKVRENALKMEK